MASVFERMVAIIEELPAIGKSQVNQQQGFKFRGHDDVLNALNPLLAKHGVFIVPDVLERIPGERQTAKGSTMYEVNLHVRFFFYGADGDLFTASTWGEGTDSGDKATNKAMTMAFKNVLIQAFAINTSDNVDADHETPEETRRGSVPRPTGNPTVQNPGAPPVNVGGIGPRTDGILHNEDGDAVIPFGPFKGMTIAQAYDAPAVPGDKETGMDFLTYAAYRLVPKADSGRVLQEAAARFLTAKKDAYDRSVLDPDADAIPFGDPGRDPSDEFPFE